MAMLGVCSVEMVSEYVVWPCWVCVAMLGICSAEIVNMVCGHIRCVCGHVGWVQC